MERGRFLMRGGLGGRLRGGMGGFQGGTGRFWTPFVLLSLLTVGRFGAMFALVVVFGNVQGDCEIGRSDELGGGAEQNAAEGKACNVFEDLGVFDGLGGGFAPGKGCGTGDEDARDGKGIERFRLEAADDDGTGVVDVALGYFLSGERFGDRYRTMEVIGVGGAEAGNGAAGLGPRGGKLGVGVDAAADLRELAAEVSMCCRIT